MALFRGFKDVFEHDETIIRNWNNTVGRKDTVWILGDITMEKTEHYYRLDCLNGYKKVVLGNHDRPQHTAELLKYVNNAGGMVDYKGSVLTHCPIHPSEFERYNKNIHGHVHENTLPDERYVNVCCEVVNYTPVLLKSLLTN